MTKNKTTTFIGPTGRPPTPIIPDDDDGDDDNGDDDDGNGMTPDDDDEMMPDPPVTPVVGIFTANNAMAMEGGQIALTLSVTSGTVPAGGLAVTLNIGVADAAEFTTTPPSVCTNLVCVITILEGATTAELILIPTDDSATETAEDWTATLVDGGENYDLDQTMDNFVAFEITDPTPPPVVVPLPTPSSARTLAELNAYDSPTNLAAGEIRAGEDAAVVGDITGFRYDDAAGDVRILVEKLDFAHLGIWITGNLVDNNFQYANLADNAVTLAADFSSLGIATYLTEGDMTYRGVRMYPGISFSMNFGAGIFSGTFSIDGTEPVDLFGDANAMLPDGIGGMRPVATNDVFAGLFEGTEIIADGFNGNMDVRTATGFFADIPIMIFTDAVNGRFHHGGNYVMGTTTPTEISGTIDGIMDSNGMELKGGFLGQCTFGC